MKVGSLVEIKKNNTHEATKYIVEVVEIVAEGVRGQDICHSHGTTFDSRNISMNNGISFFPWSSTASATEIDS